MATIDHVLDAAEIEMAIYGTERQPGSDIMPVRAVVRVPDEEQRRLFDFSLLPEGDRYVLHVIPVYRFQKFEDPAIGELFYKKLT